MADEAVAPTAGAENAGTPPQGGAPAAAPQPGASAAPPQGGTPAAAAAPAAGTIAQGAGAGTDPAAAAPADWPADWREKLSGEDKAYLKTLGRFNSPADLAKAYRAAQARISSGELKKGLGENPTPEELTTWRKENGIPETPEDYVAKAVLPQGMVLGEADKPLAADFAKMAHGKNWTPAQYNEALAWYYQNLDTQRAQQGEQDVAFKAKAEDELRGEWGAEYRRNLNSIQNLMSSWPEGLADRLLAARDPEGRLLGDNPALVKQLASLAREINPVGSLVPAGTSDPAKSITTRKVEIEAMMGDQSSQYWQGPTAPVLQKEYLDIVAALEKHSQRAA